MDKKNNRIIIQGEEARNALLRGAKAVKDSVASTYGPRGRNVLIEKPFGRPVATRDGVTVARDTYFSDRPMNMGAQLVLEAAETTNRIAGDGTSATSVLAYNLIQQGNFAIKAGKHPMQIKDDLTHEMHLLDRELDKLSTPSKKGQLTQVATVSSGDSLLGTLISEAVEHVGTDGGIITERAHTEGVTREYVEGYYLQSGFEALSNGKKELVDPYVVVAIRTVSSQADAIELLRKVVQVLGLQPGSIPRLLLVGNFEAGAYSAIVDNVNRGVIDAVIVKAPGTFGGMSKQLLEDIAIYAGCRPLTDGTPVKSINEGFIGSVERIVATKLESTMFAPSGREAVEVRVAEIRDALEVETVDQVAERLRDRMSKLTGKICIFRIGGVTDSEREEVEYRVEDAILATRAAAREGVVPGGGVTLLTLSGVTRSDIVRYALYATFQQLLKNAGLPVEVKLHEALSAPKGHAYNLKGEGFPLVDMVKAGILDPSLVVRQTVKNALTAAITALTTNTLICFEDKDV